MQNKLVALTATAFGLSLGISPVFGGYKDEIGFIDLRNELGSNTPTGAGIGVTQVEAGRGDGSEYFPGGNPDTPPLGVFKNDVFNDVSGFGSGSGHASGVGKYFYAYESIAPGAGNQASHPVDVYQASDWFDEVLSPSPDFEGVPEVETRRVQNHSWIFTSNSVTVVDGTRRADRQFDRDNVLVTAGVSNGDSTRVPAGISSTYNAIAVGRTNGDSSSGPIRSGFDGPGRIKPDIVAPGASTSFLAPRVGASAALLAQTADNMAQSSDAGQLETIKATLLTGATKDEFDLNGSTPGTFDDWNQIDDEPLDRRYGAGEVNIQNSYHTLTAGQQEASAASLVSSTGWDFDNLSQGQSNQYFFEVPDGQTAQTLSITATWNREFPDDDFDTEGLLANLDLALFGVEEGSLTLDGSALTLDESSSDIDNVEHIFQTDLASGRYAIELSRELTDDDALASGDFGLAWQAQLIPEPTSLAGFAIVGLLVLPRRRRA